MGRKKQVPMDQLAKDMIQCKKDGYGVHYGAWRAAQYEKNKGMTIVKHKGHKHICQHCGKEFYVTHNKPRKYCSEYCKNEFYRLKQPKESKAKEKPVEKKPVEKTCPICGKVFIAESYRNKYCGEFCQKVGHGQRVKEYYERKAEEEKTNA